MKNTETKKNMDNNQTNFFLMILAVIGGVITIVGVFVSVLGPVVRWYLSSKK